MKRRSAILAFLLAALLWPVPLAAQHESEWTVVTLARDGSWGVGTSEHYGPALASALRKCEAISGAKRLWRRGHGCQAGLDARHPVRRSPRARRRADLTTAIRDAQARQMFLRDLYGDGLARLLVRHVGRSAWLCREPPKSPWGAARTGLGK